MSIKFKSTVFSKLLKYDFSDRIYIKPSQKINGPFIDIVF